jgi:hypothetical protein
LEVFDAGTWRRFSTAMPEFKKFEVKLNDSQMNGLIGMAVKNRSHNALPSYSASILQRSAGSAAENKIARTFVRAF